MRNLPPAVVVLCCLAAAAPLQAQTEIAGRVVDDSTGAPIDGVRVEYLDDTARVLRSTLTNEDGAFVFHNLRSGYFRLRASRIGYQEVTTPEWGIRARETLGVELRLHHQTVALAPLEIVARRSSPILADFDHRRRGGFGSYLTRDDIARRNPAYLSDLLVTLPGIRATSSGGRGAGGRHIYIARALPGRGDGQCPVQVYLDGLLVNLPSIGGPGGDGVAIDDLVSPLDVLGIEVYRGLSSVPADFLSPDARCGVIAIWTRR